MDATATLAESGLPVGNVTETPHEDPALADMVCYQSYSVGSYVDKGTPVDLRISTGPSQLTYKYSEGITAPTEEPSYQNGMQVTVTLTADDGTQLLNTQTTAFRLGSTIRELSQQRARSAILSRCRRNLPRSQPERPKRRPRAAGQRQRRWSERLTL